MRSPRSAHHLHGRARRLGQASHHPRRADRRHAYGFLVVDIASGITSELRFDRHRFRFADPDDLAELLRSGVIAGGMRPKVEACIRAATGGVERTHIIDGRLPDSILLEVFTGSGCGTMIVGRKEKATYLGVDLAT